MLITQYSIFQFDSEIAFVDSLFQQRISEKQLLLDFRKTPTWKTLRNLFNGVAVYEIEYRRGKFSRVLEDIKGDITIKDMRIDPERDYREVMVG